MSTTRTPRRPGRPVDADRQAQRRREILAAAARIFAREGYARTDVGAISQQVGLTKASVYHYFESKEKLFFATVDAQLGEIAERMAALASRLDETLEGIGLAIETYLRYFQENPDAVELMIEERATFKTREQHTYFLYREATLEKWVSALELLIDRGVLRPLPPPAMLRMISDLLYGRVITNFFVGDARPAKEQSEEIVDVLIRGLAPSGAVAGQR